MLRSLVYRVEQIFLIHRETSLSLLHVSGDAVAAQDSDMVAGMLSAIQDFARDSFKTGSDEGLEEFRVGELQVWIAPGTHAYLAAVIRGNPPRELLTPAWRIRSRAFISCAGRRWRNFKATPLRSLRSGRNWSPACARSTTRRKIGRATERAWVVLAAGAGGVVAAADRRGSRGRRSGRISWRSCARNRDHGHPGGARTGFAARASPVARPARWPTRPLWRAPRGWIREACASSGKITRRSIRRSVLQALPNRAIRRPATATAEVAIDGVAQARRGSAPYDGSCRCAKARPRFPAFKAVRTDDIFEIVVSAAAACARQRFDGLGFGVPEGVATPDGRRERTRSVLAGEATHAWLTRVRAGATDSRHQGDRRSQSARSRSAGISSNRSRSSKARSSISCSNKDNFATEGFAALSRLPDQIRRCLAATNRLGLEAQIEVRGYADSVGNEQKNFDLSQRRADAVRDFLVKCGFEPNLRSSRASGWARPSADGEPHRNSPIAGSRSKWSQPGSCRNHDPEKSLPARHFRRGQNESRRAVRPQHVFRKIPHHGRGEDRQENGHGGRRRKSRS